MAHYISMLVLMAVFMGIGIYWAFGAQHFLKWTMRHNASLHQQIDGYLGQPILETRAQANYAKLESNGGITLFTWTIRASSREQLDALYRELSAHPMVKVVL